MADAVNVLTRDIADERMWKKLAETAGKFSFGNALTFADICLVPQYYNAIRWKCDLEKLPRCRAVYENCLSLDSCQRTAPEAQPEAKEVK